MKINEVKELDLETAGFTVEAKVLNAWEINEYKGKFGPFKKQNIQLVDGDEKIFARLSTGFVSKNDIGKDIKISGCVVSEYKDQPQIDTNEKSVVTIARAKTSAKKKEDVSPPKGFLDIVTEAIEEAQMIISHPSLKETVEAGVEAGLTSEDVRAMIISRMIEKSRGR